MMHHIASLTQFSTPTEQQFSWNCFNDNDIFLICQPLRVIFTHYKSRIVVGEDYNGKFSLQRVKLLFTLRPLDVEMLRKESLAKH